MNQKYTKEILQEIVPKVQSFAGLARELGLAPVGGTTTNLKRSCERLGVKFDHFTGQGHRKGKRSNNRLLPSDVFVELDKLAARPQAHLLRRALLESGEEYKCNVCGLTEWNGQEIRLQIDHIDGNFRNNLRSNLRFICPNCHSQTDTFGNKKRN